MNRAQALGNALAAYKPSKFGNRKVEIDGHTFASLKEGRRYSQLKLMERAGEIRELRLQPRFPLIVDHVTVAHYVGDFAYLRTSVDGDDIQIIEDVKSAFTRKNPVYRLKAKIMAAMGLPVTEV